MNRYSCPHFEKSENIKCGSYQQTGLFQETHYLKEEQEREAQNIFSLLSIIWLYHFSL